MNENRIVTDRWSNPHAERVYAEGWPAEPELKRRAEAGDQCGGCSFFATFTEDFGLCCHAKSRHHLETVFEHFTCAAYEREGWGPHSFTSDGEYHCRCGGEGSDYWDGLVEFFRERGLTRGGRAGGHVSHAQPARGATSRRQHQGVEDAMACAGVVCA